MKELRVASLGVDKTASTPVVILKEKDGERLLPIWIGPGEASAIAMEMAGIHLARPLTHDLFSAVVRALGGELVRVLITKVIDNTYFASLVFHRDGEYVSIDSRPSDAIALAVRAQVPIFADESVLDKAGILLDKETGKPILPGDTESVEGAEKAPELTEEDLRRMSAFTEFINTLDLEDFGNQDQTKDS